MLPNLVLADASPLWVLDIGDKSLRMFSFFFFLDHSEALGEVELVFISGFQEFFLPVIHALLPKCSFFLFLSLPFSLYYKCCG